MAIMVDPTILSVASADIRGFENSNVPIIGKGGLHSANMSLPGFHRQLRYFLEDYIYISN